MTVCIPKHIIPVLKSFHWVPVQYRFNFKILLVNL